MLYVEVVRAAAASRGAFVNRTLSVFVVAVYVAEFVVTDVAADSVFFILTVIALVDLVAGFSIRRARREVVPDQDDEEPQ
jgi:hypothetical protein